LLTASIHLPHVKGRRLQSFPTGCCPTAHRRASAAPGQEETLAVLPKFDEKQPFGAGASPAHRRTSPSII
jgi:hypothetical protein